MKKNKKMFYNILYFIHYYNRNNVAVDGYQQLPKPDNIRIYHSRHIPSVGQLIAARIVGYHMVQRYSVEPQHEQVSHFGPHLLQSLVVWKES